MRMEKTTGKLVRGVVVGTLIGAAISLLIAPNSGKDTRQAIGNKITPFRRRYQSLVAFLQGATPKPATSALSGQKKTSSLSRREIEVLLKLAEGFRNRDIAESLGISEKTVERHLEHIYPKLGVTNRTSALVCAVHDGLVA